MDVFAAAECPKRHYSNNCFASEAIYKVQFSAPAGGGKLYLLATLSMTSHSLVYLMFNFFLSSLPLNPLLNGWLTILGKLSLSLFLGGVVGWERQRDHKPAGLRTHILVSLGSTMFVMIPFHTEVSMTHSQIIQGVAQGIGFLGAGEIMRNPQARNGQEQISGLTSAAAIWVAAALGSIVGAGLYAIAIFGAIFTLVTLRVLKKLETKN